MTADDTKSKRNAAPGPGARIRIASRKYPDQFALVDDVDADLSAMTWCIAASPGDRVLYARQSGNLRDGVRSRVRMHQLIMERIVGRPLRRGEMVDHHNGIGLDNRRSNLRLVSGAQNQANRRLSRANTSGFKGVFREPRYGGWIAKIQPRGRRRFLGRFATAEEAARAYDIAARETYGEYACLNFPSEGEQGVTILEVSR